MKLFSIITASIGMGIVIMVMTTILPEVMNAMNETRYNTSTSYKEETLVLEMDQTENHQEIPFEQPVVKAPVHINIEEINSNWDSLDILS